VELTPAPESIAGYPMVRAIARGGMAEVYEVADPNSGEHVALKLLLEMGSALPRFNREYEAMTQLNHPNIVRVFHYGLHEGMPWLTMELLDGAPIQTYVKDLGRAGCPLRNAEVLRAAYVLSDALQYVHDRGLVHRDLKSANVIVLPDGRLKLFDFGAAYLKNPVEVITREGEFIGTFAYASPEQITGRRIDHRSDLYSFGVLLYRLATGKLPFRQKEAHALAKAHVNTPPTPPREIVPELPQALEQVILWLMEKDPEDRPDGAREIQDILSRASAVPLNRLPGSGIAVSVERPVGRDDEQRTTLRMLDPHTPGESVLVVGGPGSQRERFATAVGASAAVDGWAVEHLRILPAGGLSGFLQVVRDLGNRAGCPDFASRLESPELEATLLPDVRQTMERASAELFVELAARSGKPQLFVVHDAHHLGPLALELLVAARGHVMAENAAVNFLLTSDNSVDGLFSPLRARWSDDNRVDLGPLGARQVALAVGAMLNRRPPPAELAARIHEASGGQPGFVEEIVRGLAEHHLLRVHPDDGNRLEWSGDEIAKLGVPPSARAWLEQSLARVPRAHQGVLQALGLAGGAATLDVLAEALELDPDEVRVLVDALVGGGWVRREGFDLKLIGPLAGRVLVDGMQPARRRVLEQNVARALSTQVPTPALVTLLVATRQFAAAIPAALATARTLVAEGRHATALDVLERVAPLTEQTPGLDTELLGELHLLHTHCLMVVRPTDTRTARSLVAARRHAEAHAAQARVDVTKARMQWVIGHYPNFRKFLLQAWETHQDLDLPAEAAEIARLLAQSYLWSGQPRTAGDWYQRGRELAQRSGDALAIAHADVGVANWHAARGELELAEQRVEEARASFTNLGNDLGIWEALAVRTSILRQQARYSEALEALAPELPRARQSQATSLYVGLLLATALCEVDVSRLGRAAECLDELDVTLRSGEYLHLRIEAGIVRGRILLASGQREDAEEALRDAFKRASTAQLLILAEQARSLHAEVLWQLGDHAEAREAFQAAILGLMGTGDVSALAFACVAQARAMGAVEPDEVLFRPVRDSVAVQVMPVVILERLLATARGCEAKGDTERALRNYKRAAKQLNKMGMRLNDTDRAALRVHPWSQAIRVGLA